MNWPAHCMKPAHPEVGEAKPCEEDVEVAILSKSGNSPDMFLCRAHALEFMAVLSMSTQAEILAKSIGGMSDR